MGKQKKYTFKKEEEREVGVCIAVQKIGLASVNEVINKIEKWGGRITEKQVNKCLENLRRKQLLSIDLTEKDENGISVKRYVMKSIKLTIPEAAQIKDIIDDPSLNVLKDELDRAKKTQKKGLKTYDYYHAEVLFKALGDIQGFMPDGEKISRHYRKGKDIVFYPYHFKNWLRGNMGLINRSKYVVEDMKFQQGIVNLNGNIIKCPKPYLPPNLPIIEKMVTNIEDGASYRGSGGRGSRFAEAIPEGSTIKTGFFVPRDLIQPQHFEKALTLISDSGGAFGGGAKLSTGKLKVEKVEIVNEKIWEFD